MHRLHYHKAGPPCAKNYSHSVPPRCLATAFRARGAPLPAIPDACAGSCLAGPGQSLVFRKQPTRWQQAVHRSPVRLNVAAAAAAGRHGHGSRSWHTPGSVTRLCDALNARDAAPVGACVAAGVAYENMAIQDSLAGRLAVGKFYAISMAAMPREGVSELERVTGAAGSAVTVVWKLLLTSSQALLSRGIALYTCQPGSGLIRKVTECHEHPLKLSYSQLLLVRPLVAGLAGPLPAVLPVVQEVGRCVQQGVDALLQPLIGLLAPPSITGIGSSSSSSGFGGDGTSSIYTTNNSSSSSSISPASFAAAASSPPTAAAAAAAAAALSASAEEEASTGVAGAKPRHLPKACAAAGAGNSAGAADGSPSAEGVAGAETLAAGGAAAPVNLSGVWVKDAARSDLRGYDAALDVLGLSGMQKVTARLIEGVEVHQTASKFTVSFLTVVPFFKVTEEVPLNGGSTQQRRRDLRQGRQTAAARSVSSPQQQGVLVEMSWGPPLEGSLTELYTLLPDGCLAVTADTRVGSQQARSVTVYRRSAGSREALLADSRRRSGSVADVLRQQQDQGLTS